MQQRHKNRKQYFDELALTSEKYYLPFLKNECIGRSDMSILEIGCGEGGNLKPFIDNPGFSCSRIVGLDRSINRIEQAKEFYRDEIKAGKIELIASDIFEIKDWDKSFDIILLHDVIEHITDKQKLLAYIQRFLTPGGTLFIGFPAWQMPFGGHQQTCRSKIASHLPFFHLLPAGVYKSMLKCCNETPEKIFELLDTKECGISVEKFKKLISGTNLEITKECLYFINPHYEAKFNLKPRRLSPVLKSIPYVRNFFTTSCFYLLKNKIEN